MPGWYPGRTVHMHLMVHTPARTYISQLCLPDDVTNAVFARQPYRHHNAVVLPVNGAAMIDRDQRRYWAEERDRRGRLSGEDEFARQGLMALLDDPRLLVTTLPVDPLCPVVDLRDDVLVGAVRLGPSPAERARECPGYRTRAEPARAIPATPSTGGPAAGRTDTYAH